MSLRPFFYCKTCCLSYGLLGLEIQHRGGGPQVALADLKEMRSTSEKEFGLLNKKYKELMGLVTKIFKIHLHTKIF